MKWVNEWMNEWVPGLCGECTRRPMRFSLVSPRRAVLSWLFIYLFIFSHFIFIYLVIYFWLCWVFVSVWGLSLVAASRGHSSSRRAGLSLSRPLLLRSTGSRCAGSVIAAHRPSCFAACGIIPDQGSNPCPLHWQADSQPLRHQGSPVLSLLKKTFHSSLWHRHVDSPSNTLREGVERPFSFPGELNSSSLKFSALRGVLRSLLRQLIAEVMEVVQARTSLPQRTVRLYTTSRSSVSCTLSYVEWINNKALLYSTGNYIQYPVMNHNGKEYEKECICKYHWLTLLYSRH